MVDTPHPETLLGHPSILGVAPWCRYLENFELTLLFAAPLRDIGRPLTRGELGKRVEDVPEMFVGKPQLGDLYYQRISRTVKDLEDWQILARLGGGRRHGYVLTPFGFVALILNLRALKKDPLFEPAEFEMRRETVAAISIMLSTLLGGAGRPGMSRDVHAFFRDVDDVSVAGTRVMSPKLVVDTTSILSLIGRQRANLERRRLELEQAAAGLEREHGSLKNLKVELPRNLTRDAASERLLTTAWDRARLTLPFLSVRALRAGYARYAGYLDDLVTIYSGALDEVSLSDYRHARGKA